MKEKLHALLRKRGYMTQDQCWDTVEDIHEYVQQQLTERQATKASILNHIDEELEAQIKKPRDTAGTQQAFIDGIDRARAIIESELCGLEELEQQLAETNAKIERQNTALLIAIHNMSGGDAKAEVKDVYDETPKQSLAHINAEVIEEFKKSFMQGLISKQINDYDFDDYANQLREGE